MLFSAELTNILGHSKIDKPLRRSRTRTETETSFSTESQGNRQDHAGTPEGCYRILHPPKQVAAEFVPAFLQIC